MSNIYWLIIEVMWITLPSFLLTYTNQLTLEMRVKCRRNAYIRAFKVCSYFTFAMPIDWA